MPLPSSERLIERGLTLIATAEVEAPEAAERARQTLAQWRARSPEHEAAAVEALRRWQMLGGMVDELRGHFDEPAPVVVAGPRHATLRRRQALRAIAGLGSVIAVGTGTAWYWHQPVFEQTLHMGTAQTGSAPLPDGSRIDLNARTDLSVQLYRQRRVVTLRQGEARFEVAADASRPFTVETRVGTVTVVGTAFTVNDRGGPVSIQVEHGHVRFKATGSNPGFWLSRSDPAEPPIDLHAGQSLTLRNGLPGPVTRLAQGQAAAWRDGWLVFDNMRLDEALPAINAHREHALVLGDPRVAAMPLTGRFRAAESDRLVDALPAILPVRAVTLRDGRIELQSMWRAR
ncbi:MAG: iron dicitrate transport regulator FecR [Rubrivivax sp.]|nr:MAG: iron dicitrate transport regulator FecR [Rubrivivax sp.]